MVNNKLTAEQEKEVLDIVNYIKTARKLSYFQDLLRDDDTHERRAEISRMATEECDFRKLKNSVYFNNEQVKLFEKEYNNISEPNIKDENLNQELKERIIKAKDTHSFIKIYEDLDKVTYTKEDLNKTLIRYSFFEAKLDRYYCTLLPLNFLEGLAMSYTRLYLNNNKQHDKRLQKRIKKIFKDKDLVFDNELYKIYDDFIKVINKD